MESFYKAGDRSNGHHIHNFYYDKEFILYQLIGLRIYNRKKPFRARMGNGFYQPYPLDYATLYE